MFQRQVLHFTHPQPTITMGLAKNFGRYIFGGPHTNTYCDPSELGIGYDGLGLTAVAWNEKSPK